MYFCVFYPLKQSVIKQIEIEFQLAILLILSFKHTRNVMVSMETRRPSGCFTRTAHTFISSGIVERALCAVPGQTRSDPWSDREPSLSVQSASGRNRRDLDETYSPQASVPLKARPLD